MSAKPSKDFSKPETTIRESSKILSDALAKGDGDKMIDALITYLVASDMISSENAQSFFDKIDEIASAEKNPANRALLNLIEAKLYLDYYFMNDREDLDNRTTVKTDTIPPVELWSGEMLKNKIMQLISLSLSEPEILKSTKITKYPSIILTDNRASALTPTLFDFISYKAIDFLTLSYFHAENRVLPQNVLMTGLSNDAIPPSVLPLNRLAIEISNNWLTFRHEANAPGVIARISWINLFRSLVIMEDINYLEYVTKVSEHYFNQYKSTPYSVELLLDELSISKDDLYSSLKEAVKLFPDYYRIGCVKNMIAEIEHKNLHVEIPERVPKNVPVTFTCNYNNVNDGTIEIYSVPDDYTKDDSYYYPKFAKTPLKLYKSIKINSDNILPFEESKKLEVTFDNYGRYIIIPAIDGEKTEANSYRMVVCTDILMVSSFFEKENDLFTINFRTGLPEEGVEVFFEESKTKIISVTSDSSGLATKNIPQGYKNIHAVKGKDKFSSFYTDAYRHSPSDRLQAYINTDLPLYRPGDEMNFVAVIYDVRNQKTVGDKMLTVCLSDANRQPLDSLDLKTDNFGRLTGSFRIPEDVLTGDFKLDVFTKDYNEGLYATKYFTVSDYKLPTFEVAIDNITINSTPEKTVDIQGSATTYSGFPIANASVNIIVNNSNSFWLWMSQEVEIDVIKVATDENGKFKAVLPADAIASLPFPKGILSFNVNVTSETGETQFATRGISVGKPFSPSGNIPSAICSDMQTVKLHVSFCDINGKPQNLPAKITVKNDSLDLTFDCPSSASGYELSVGNLPSGKYTLTIAPLDADLSDEITEKIIVYSKNDAVSPVDMLIWLPDDNFSVKPEDSSAKVLVFAQNDDTPVLMLSANSLGETTYSWLNLHSGANNIDVPCEAFGKYVVKLFSVRNGQLVTCHINLSKENPAESLEISIENFRDKTVPLSEETLKIRVKDKTGTPRRAALILDMYSKAIDAIQHHNSSIQFYKVNCLQYFRINNNIGYRVYATKTKWNDAAAACPQFSLASLNLYDHSFFMNYGRNRLVYYSVRYGSGPKRSMKSAPMAVEEEATVSYDYATMNDSVMAVAEDADDMGDDEIMESDASSDNNYRPSEIPLAFFSPMLSTNENGELEYSFTLPNANTTWLFAASAFTDNLLSANSLLETVASKPVMVEINAPRFIRVGDRAVMAVAVMNNNDEPQTIKTVIKVEDALTGKLISQLDISDCIDGMRSKPYSFDVEGLADVSAFNVTVLSSAQNYSDGEKIMLPVLSQNQFVTDSYTFYLAPEIHKKTVELPQADNARKVLTFCENPAWEVVSALPGLMYGETDSSFGATASIFSAAIADGIMNRNPQIRDFMQSYLAESSNEGAVLSSLEKNQELKSLLLGQTPWVADAMNDNARISRLALIFDAKNVENSIQKALSQLVKLQNADGGLRWINQYESSSEFATANFLLSMGLLKNLGYLPSDKKLNALIDKTLKYYDNSVAKASSKNKDYINFLYAYIRSMFERKFDSTASQKVYDSTVNYLIKEWKNFDTTSKAMAAITLYRSNYQNVSRQIIESLNEFAVVHEEQGASWPSAERSSLWSLTANSAHAIILQAYSLIDPQSKLVDGVRQWLILNKRVQNWGNSVDTSRCIAAILGAGTDWNNKNGDVTVKIDGKKLDIDKFDKLTGSFTVVLPSEALKVEFSRKNDGPAWGAVLAEYEGKMSDIKAHEIPEISIVKNQIVRRGDINVATDSLMIGDVVEVTLILKTSRDMDYLVITDERPACFEPVIQISRPLYCDGAVFYLENRDNATNMFINRLPKGTYILKYEMVVNNAGAFSSGVASVESYMAPELTAHSAGSVIVSEK